MTALGDEGLRVRAAATRLNGEAARARLASAQQFTLRAPHPRSGAELGGAGGHSERARGAALGAARLRRRTAVDPGRRLLRSAKLHARNVGHKKRFVCKKDIA